MKSVVPGTLPPFPAALSWFRYSPIVERIREGFPGKAISGTIPDQSDVMFYSFRMTYCQNMSGTLPSTSLGQISFMYVTL